ncbi:YciI family protein [Nitriliruptor alkaliphilus]|uniref:YciI family protein n=1 Tax=Nitriliruptor alkaliphilus TaxID=427918 RepID=UPI000698EA84|nr:YciI family protein [Nitriliruptor alkaliphilus]
MPDYLLSVVYPPDAVPPTPSELEEITARVDAFHAEVQAAGAWVFGGGLHDPSTATVVHPGDGETLITDGPFAETKEVVGGLSIIRAADLDEALRWAEKAALATTVPIEVRPFVDDAG